MCLRLDGLTCVDWSTSTPLGRLWLSRWIDSDEIQRLGGLTLDLFTNTEVGDPKPDQTRRRGLLTIDK